MPCEICPRLKNAERVVFENKTWIVSLSPDQGYLGRCFVMLKRHCGALSELTPSDWADFTEVVNRLEPALKKAFGATMFNWGCLMNNAYKEQNPQSHIHWHFRPRYSKKVEFCGLVFEDPNFAHHYDSKYKKEVSAENLEKISEKIKSNL